jgi:dUTPase
MRINVYRTAPAKDLPLPARAHESDIGYDLCSAIDFTVAPGDSIKVPTGLVFNLSEKTFYIGGFRLFGFRLWGGLPFGIALIIKQRTGNGGKGLFPAATEVDPGYRPIIDDYIATIVCDPFDPNGLVLWLRNVGNDTLTFKRGDKVVQGLFELRFKPKLVDAPFKKIKRFTARGAKRFGATGS